MVEELWIINRDGICYFHRWINRKTEIENITNHVQIEEQLFSGLLSGILKFTSQVTSDKIEKIEMKEGKFLFFTKKDLIFIVRTKIHDSDDKIKTKIQMLEELFIQKFDNQLDEFDGDINKFQIFEKDLDEIFNKITKSEKWGKGIIDL
ncbi:MAG TPA: hypothetical protein VGB37_14125 [Candidatus Lokiarchaeia archaeon]